MTKEELKKKYYLTERQFTGEDLIEGTLKLNSLKEIPSSFNPTVACTLDLSNLKTIPEGSSFNPQVGGNLYLNSLKEIPSSFNPIVGGNLWLSRLKEIPETSSFNPTTGGDLYLHSLKEIPSSFNPTVGGSLWLNSLKEIPETSSFNPIVGGSLWLDSLETPRKFDNTDLGYEAVEPLLTWNDGKYRMIDNMFCEVLSDKGSILKVKYRNEVMYAVTNGSSWAHGATIKEAREDLIYKISNRDKSKYENINTDKKYSLKECIEMYRVITGACSMGTKSFVKAQAVGVEDEFTVKELIELTTGQFGATTFKEFFA